MWLKLLNRSWFPGLNVSHCKLPEEKCGGLKPRSRGLGWIKITQKYISHWTLSRLFSTNWLWFKRMDRPFEFLVRLQFKGKSGKMGSSFSGVFCVALFPYWICWNCQPHMHTALILAVGVHGTKRTFHFPLTNITLCSKQGIHHTNSWKLVK